ncbi:checkpoint protein HUS1 isoform X1 [Lingula anatina]|uniref:Checkpoint protein n=1 Tax=Lingula anatina TaxID=7574 RepID=A0A1S3H1U6_LINAN|nr:checkpoint protein HUS1 isoform X1 [Lingula anatina]|eukprot:XP_013379912.1 checkpoint protein HUS1 isoform X1 [Lingula anatina]
MRFRGKIVDVGCIQHFTRVISMVAKLAKNCTVRITASKIYFILSERLVNGGVNIWCELSQTNFFSEYAMDGLSEDYNEIFLEVVPDNMVKCLKTAQTAKSVKIKLTKKHSPCLTFEVELPSLTGHSRVVTHDVPVNVIPRRLWDEFEEPEMPDFDVSIYMPSLKVLRNVTDKMKNLNNYVTIAANGSGEMVLKVETDMASVSTHFGDLSNPQWSKENMPAAANSQPKDRDPEKFAEARIDIRKFSQFLSGQQVNPERVICNILDNRVVHFFLLHDDVSLQYFMPVISS